jgi:hypothetical protein
VPRSSILLSCFIVFHLTAICLEAIPKPDELESVHGERMSPDDTLSRLVRPWLDEIQPSFEGSARWLREVLGPVRRVTEIYVQNLTFGQNWRMFAQPPRSNSWLVIRIFSRMRDGTRDVETTLGVPGTGLYSWKLAGAYRPGFHDKAVSSALDEFLLLLRKTPPAPDDAVTRLRPVARYYEGERRRRLAPGDTIERLEIWHGYQMMSARGDPDVPRVDLDRCYSRLPDGAPLRTYIRVDDTHWVLIRVDGPQTSR